MRTYLHHDAQSGELHLVMADLWNGQHEATSYHVITSEGRPLRNRPDMDGVAVRGSEGAWYVTAPHGGRIPVRTDPAERATAVKTPCRKAGNARRKCQLCAELAA